MANALTDGRVGPVAADRPRQSVAAAPRRSWLPPAGAGETFGLVARLLAPTIAEGPIVRQPWIAGLTERLDLDHRAIEYLQRLRRRYRGPLMLGPLRARAWAVVLSARHAQRALRETSDPSGLTEAPLDAWPLLHAISEVSTHVVVEETDELLRATSRPRELTWPAFATAWLRIVRRIVFGDAARDDVEATDLVARLRAHANWGVLRPIQSPLREQSVADVHERLAAAPPGTLAWAMRMHRPSGPSAPAHQIPPWLFAFDAAGTATLRAVALLASHPLQAMRARQEMRAAARDGGVHQMRYVHACVLESLRLWPSTPLILRQTAEETVWDDGVMPAQTGLVIYAPFFLRDEERLPFAHRFWPEVWLQERPPEEVWTLLPFSDGPARCPGRQLVELIASTMLARLFDGRSLTLTSHPRFGPHRPLPVTLGHHALRFTIAPQGRSI